MSSNQQQLPIKPSLFTFVVGFVVFVIVPALVTAIAPIAVTHFERQGEVVAVRTSRNLLFVIPYKRAEIQRVTEVNERLQSGRVSETRSSTDGRKNKTRSEDEAFLVILGSNGKTEVPVSPVNLRKTVDQAKGFLADPKATRLRLITVANWKFSVVAGGIASLLTLLFVVGWVLQTLKFIWMQMRPQVEQRPVLPPGAA